MAADVCAAQSPDLVERGAVRHPAACHFAA
jgi:hypothetical protein